MALRSGTTVVAARRGIVVLHRDATPLLLEPALGEELARCAADGQVASPALRQRLGDRVDGGGPLFDDGAALASLAEHDMQLAALLPGVEPELERLRRAQARRRICTWPETALPLPPLSTWTLAEAVRRLAPRHVLLREDLDGASALIGAFADVSVDEGRPRVSAWLQTLWGELGAARARLSAHSPQVDLAVVSVAAPSQASAAVAYAHAAGRTIVRARALAEAAVRRAAAAAGRSVAVLSRGLLLDLFPGGLTSGDNGVLLLVEGAWTAAPAPSERAAQPYVLLDVDNVAAQDPARLLGQLADVLAVCAPRPEHTRRVAVHDERATLTWFDEVGAGITVEVGGLGTKAVVTLLPYDFELEVALMCAAGVVLGPELTRVRTQTIPPFRGAGQASST